MKFNRRPEAARLMAALMAEALPRPFLGNAVVLIPPALHWRRRLQRGFDQAQLLSLWLHRLTGLPLQQSYAATAQPPPKSRLPREARSGNLAGAFLPASPPQPGLTPVLVDDVATTGATLSAGQPHFAAWAGRPRSIGVSPGRAPKPTLILLPGGLYCPPFQGARGHGHALRSALADKVLTILEGEGYVLDAQLMALNSYENRVYQIGQCERPAAHRQILSPRTVERRSAFRRTRFYGGARGADIPAVPLANGAGETLRISEEGLRFALYRIAGRAPDLEDDEALAVLGRLLGRIHAVGALEPFEHRPALTVASFGHDSRGFLLETGRLPFSLESAYETLSADLLALIEERFSACAPETVRLHGDCHLGNLLWQEGVAHFVDFDDARQGPAVHLWLFTSGDVTEQGPQLGSC